MSNAPLKKTYTVVYETKGGKNQAPLWNDLFLGLYFFLTLSSGEQFLILLPPIGHFVDILKPYNIKIKEPGLQIYYY